MSTDKPKDPKPVDKASMEVIKSIKEAQVKTQSIVRK